MNSSVNALTMFIVLICFILVVLFKGVEVTYTKNNEVKTEYMSWSEFIELLEVSQ